MRRRRGKRKRSGKVILGRWRNQVAHLTFNQGVPGSIPGRPIFHAPVVQRIKTLGYGPRNPGSNPGGGAWGPLAQRSRAQGFYPWCRGFESFTAR